VTYGESTSTVEASCTRILAVVEYTQNERVRTISVDHFCPSAETRDNVAVMHSRHVNRLHCQQSTCKRAITSKIKHAIKLKTSPARLARLLQSSLAFCFSLQPITASSPGRYAVIGCKLTQNDNEGCNSCATAVQILQDLFHDCMFYFTCDRSLTHSHS